MSRLNPCTSVTRMIFATVLEPRGALPNIVPTSMFYATFCHLGQRCNAQHRACGTGTSRPKERRVGWTRLWLRQSALQRAWALSFAFWTAFTNARACSLGIFTLPVRMSWKGTSVPYHA